MNMLFTCAGRRNYLINYFKESLHGNGVVFAVDMDLTAPALVDADVAFQVPEIYSDKYIPSLVRIIRDNHIEALISLNDLELPVLAEFRDELVSEGIKLILPSDFAINTSFDKWQTVNFLNLNSLKTPRTFISLDEAINSLEEGDLNFPVVIKPRWGSASIGIEFPESISELKLAFALQQEKLQRTILKHASNDELDRAILIQEKIIGKEYGIDVLNDFDGNYIGTFAREKLSMRSGETDKAISVVDDRIEMIGRNIGESLQHVGNLDCDVLENVDGELFILEMNPRFGGGYPFSHEAGANSAAVYIDWLKGNTDISKHIQYQAGIMFSKCDRLMRIDTSLHNRQK